MNMILVCLFCLQLFCIYNFNSKITEIEEYASVANKINTDIVADNRSYLVNSQLFDAYLFYALKSRNINDFEVKYVPGVPMSADTINKKDYVIIDIDLDETKHKKALYSNSHINVYQ